MKKYFLLLIFVSFSQFLFCQSVGKYFSGTLEPGSESNSVYVVIKSNATLTGVKFSTFQFELGIPTSSVSARPVFTITSLDPTIGYATDGAIEKQDGQNYYGFGFSGDGSLSGSGTDFTAGDEHIIAEVFFTGSNPSVTSQVRMMQLPDGGSTGNVNFYLADRGADVTNTDSQFYGGSMFSNDGNGYDGSSYVYLTSLALPVKLSSFTVNVKNTDALLAWSVENQDANSSHFEIERSANGINFSPIGTVDATSESKASYSYTDENINLSGTVYYRLKMVDKNGQFDFSDVKSIHLNNLVFSANLYPNPVKTNAKLSIELSQAQTIKASVNDALGNLVKQIQITGQKGVNEKTLDLSSIPSGSYIIRIQAGQNLKTIPFIKN